MDPDDSLPVMRSISHDSSYLHLRNEKDDIEAYFSDGDAQNLHSDDFDEVIYNPSGIPAKTGRHRRKFAARVKGYWFWYLCKLIICLEFYNLLRWRISSQSKKETTLFLLCWKRS